MKGSCKGSVRARWFEGIGFKLFLQGFPFEFMRIC